MLKECEDYSFDEIKVGMKFGFIRNITIKDHEDFARLTGNYNPLHTDEEYAKNTQFLGRISYGMLLGSLFSTLLGMFCPGKRALCLSQTLNFRKSIPINEEVEVIGEVLNKSTSTKIVTIKTLIINKSRDLIIDGVAKVMVLEK